jgi:hypothetical protein
MQESRDCSYEVQANISLTKTANQLCEALDLQDFLVPRFEKDVGEYE